MPALWGVDGTLPDDGRSLRTCGPRKTCSGHVSVFDLPFLRSLFVVCSVLFRVSAVAQRVYFFSQLVQTPLTITLCMFSFSFETYASYPTFSDHFEKLFVLV